MSTAETLVIRPISPDDKQQFVEAFERLSERSRAIGVSFPRATGSQAQRCAT